MSNSKPIVVDTNIIFSALLKSNSNFTRLLLLSDYQFFVCEQMFVEIFKYKEKIVKLSQLSEDDIIEVYKTLIKKLNLYKEDLISFSNCQLAYQLCQNIDINDVPHIALTLELNGLLWTGDKKLKQGLLNKNFTQFFEVT